MENRYLFKAKRIDNGEWVVGYLYRLSENNPPFIMLRKYGESYEVDRNTICQCTGVEDKNGNLIWENDIVKDNVIYGVVIWEDVNARYIIDDRNDGYQDYSEWWSEVEAIGNIFDNQELSESEG